MKKHNLIILAAAVVIISILGSVFTLRASRSISRNTWWTVQSIDVMKYSRDIAREKLNDPSFVNIVENQVRNIAGTGATHIAVATPYDEEFLPFLKLWVNSAKKHKLNVWFRGNFSGWEGWFDYPVLSREEHAQKIETFILSHPDLFSDGDIFTSCPECENGGPGDPRLNNDVVAHRKFLIYEYQITKGSFKKIGKNVASNYNSMNGDVAKLIMDRETTKALDGIVVIDHYVASPEQLVNDIKNLALTSGGKVMLGEFGVPIPDLHGNLTEQEQAKWIKEALERLTFLTDLAGVNYWVSVGGSTQLWDSNGKARSGVGVLTSYFNPNSVKGVVRSKYATTLKARVSYRNKSVETNSSGYFDIPYFTDNESLFVTAEGYLDKTVMTSTQKQVIYLDKKNESLLEKIYRYIRMIIRI